MRYLLVIVLSVFSWTISVAQISVFPHNENFESFTTCFESCSNPCTLSSGWNNPSTDGTDWIVDNNGTLTPGTGPSANGGADHNPGIAGGKYLYLESSGCNSVTGFLETPVLDFTSGTYPYFTFWYHMYGGSMGTLHIDISTDGGTTYTNNIVPSITSNINAWQQATVALAAYGGQTVKIRFRGITGIGGSSDMAIDDVTFYLVDQMDVSVTNIQSNDSLFCDYATNELCVEITNNDTIQLDSGILNVRINGTLFNSPFPFTVSSLAPGASTTVCLGQAPLVAGDVVSAVISMPNGVGDPVSSNDSLAETIVLQALPTINLTPDTLICPDDTITLGGSPTGPTGATYLWANSGGYLSSTSISNPLASTGGVVMYYVTVTDTIGCVSNDSVQVSNHSLPVVDAGSDVALCPSASYTFGGAPTSPTGVNYEWYGPTNGLLSTLSNPTLVIANLGQYVVFVEDANTCVNSDTMFVTAPANAVPNAGNDVTICQNDSIQIGDVSSAAYVYYSWTPSASLNNSSISNPTALASVATQYVLEVQDTFGCVLYDTVNVGVFTLPTVNAGANTTICSLDSLQLGGTPTSATAISFEWSPGVLMDDSTIANPMAFVPADTTFYLTVTDANGCSAMDSIVVLTDSIPFIDAGLDVSLCYGDITLIGGFPAGLAGSTYHWSPGELLNDSTIANPQYTVLANQTFILEVTDTNGCHGFDSVTVSINTASTLPQTADTTVCINDTFSLLSTPSAAFNTYSWSASTYISNVNSNPIQTYVTGTTQYIVAAADTFGCGYVDTIMVYAFAAPFADAGSDVVSCFGDSVQIGGSPSGIAGSTYNWTGGGLLSSATAANPMAAAIGDTSFILTVIDSNTCVAYDTMNFTTNALPLVDAGVDQAGCIGSSVIIGGAPSGDISSSFAWSPSIGLSSASVANPTYTISDTIQFFLTVTDTNGCISVDSMTVNAYPLSTLNAGVDTAICIGEQTTLGGAPTATNLGSVDWSPGLTLNDSTSISNPIATPTSTTIYMATLTDAFGCVYTDNVTITVNQLPIVNAGLDTVTNCAYLSFNVGGSPTGPAGSTYSWSPGSLFNDSTLANPSVTVSGNEMLYLAVEDANGCFNYDTVVVNIYSIPNVDAGPATVMVCLGDSAQLGGAPTSTTVGATYQWSNSALLSDDTASNPMAYLPAPMYYYLTVTEPINGCINIDSIFVDNLPLPDVDAGGNLAMCIGDSIMLGGTPTSTSAISYAWSPNNGTLSDTSIANPFSNSLINATYILTVTDNQGCVNMDTVSLTINPLPTTNITASNIPCHGDTIQITATGGATYQWANDTYFSSLTAADPMVLINDTITLNVQVTDTNGCVNVDSITVNPYTVPVADAGPDLSVCVGQSVQIQGVTATNFNWSPDSSLVNFNTLTPVSTPDVNTDYILTSTTGGGQCIVYDTMTVTLTPLPVFTLVDSVDYCNFSFGDVAPISSENLTYSWSTNTANIALQNAMDSALSFSASDSGYIFIQGLNPSTGCISYDSVFVIWHPKPVATASSTPVINCIGDSIQLEAFGGDIYQWYPSQGLSNAAISNPILVVYADTTLNAIVTSNEGCADTVAVPIAAADLVVANAGPDVEICQLDTIQLGATGGLTYEWIFDASLSANNIPNPNAYPAFTKTYTVIAYDQYGCNDDDQVTVIVNALPNVSAGVPKSVCLGQSVQIGGNPTGPSNSNYSWSPSTSVDDAATSNPFVSPTVDTRYYVTVTTSKGCQDSSSVMVTVNPLPTLNLVSGPETICRNDSTSISVTPGIKKYRWSPSTYMLDSTKATVIVYPKQSTIYTVTATDNNGCFSTLDVSVDVNQLPIITPMETKEICFGDSVEIEAYSATAASYVWSPGAVVTDSNSNITFAKPTSTTNLLVYVTDQYGCMNKASQRVIVNALPFADAGDDISDCEMDAVYIGGNPTANAGDIVTWTPAEYLDNPYALNPLALTPERTTFVLTVQNSQGCYTIDSVEVNADCYALIYAPNAFTPGNNGINDLFKISYYRIKEPRLTIYNRLGQVVYETTNLDKGWDGVSSTMGSDCEAGVYYWVLVYKSEDSKKLSKDGTVTILR